MSEKQELKTINLAPRWMGLARPFIKGYLDLQKDCEYCIGNAGQSKFVASLLEDACTQMDKRNDEIKEELGEDTEQVYLESKVLGFMLSPKGRLRMAKVIHYGLEVMTQVEEDLIEKSDIEDIKKIRNTLFSNLILENDLQVLPPKVITKIERQQNEK
tara:strand:- start:9119 stop:9592 length:474 start_codon:yes stop_codon:yes gene_type:complete